jgi:hypothetical protein
MESFVELVQLVINVPSYAPLLMLLLMLTSTVRKSSIKKPR